MEPTKWSRESRFFPSQHLSLQIVTHVVLPDRHPGRGSEDTTHDGKNILERIPPGQNVVGSPTLSQRPIPGAWWFDSPSHSSSSQHLNVIACEKTSVRSRSPLTRIMGLPVIIRKPYSRFVWSENQSGRYRAYLSERRHLLEGRVSGYVVHGVPSICLANDMVRFLWNLEGSQHDRRTSSFHRAEPYANITPIRVLEVEDCGPVIRFVFLESTRRACCGLGVVDSGIHTQVEPAPCRVPEFVKG